MGDFERLAAELDIQEEERVRKLQQVPPGWSGTPTGTTGYEVKMMWEDIGIPKRVESQRNGEWVLVCDLIEEQNRSVLCDGHTWILDPSRRDVPSKRGTFVLGRPNVPL